MTVPGITVLFDDGSGTFPNDVSSRVSLANVSVGPFGRADESTTATTNSLSLLLRNDDGFFTGHGVGWDSGPWDSGLWGGSLPLVVGQKVRVIYTVASVAVDQFTGRVSELGQVWGGGTGLQSSVAVSALDAMSDLGRRTLRSMLEEEILLRSPFAYYTLGEPEGATSAGDTSGVGAPLLTPDGKGTPPAFGAGTGPVDGLTAVQFADGGYLGVQTTDTYIANGTPFSFVLFLSTTTIPGTAGSTALSVYPAPGTAVNDAASIFIDDVGRLRIAIGAGQVNTTGSIADGDVRCVIGTYDGAGILTGYVDGVSIGTDGTGILSHAGTDVSVGDDALDPSDAQQFTGWASHLAFYATVLSASDAANIASAGLTGCAGETTDARLTRLASYVGITASTSAPSGQLMEGQSTSGSTALDAFDAVAQAEGGFLFIAGDGTLTMQGRYYRSYKTTADWTVKGTDLTVASSVAVTVDTQQLINQVTVTRIGGATQIAVDQDSIDNSGVFSTSFDLAIPSDLDALGAAQWYVAKHATTGPRMASVPVNMMTSPNVANLFKMKIGDRVSFSSMPTQLWSDFADVTIEGWSDSLSVSGGSVSWTRTYNLLPWSLNEVALYDDAGSLYDVAVYGY